MTAKPDDAEPTDLRPDRVTHGLLAASKILTQPRNAGDSNDAALTPDVDLRLLLQAAAMAARSVLRPSTSEGSTARRVVLCTAAIASVVAAVCWHRQA